MAALTIKKKITIAIIPIVLICLFLFIGITYIYVSNLIKVDLSDNILKTVQEKSNTIDVWVKSHMIETESIAQTPAARNINKGFGEIDELNRYRYTYLLQTYPKDYAVIYSGNVNGIYHTIQKRKEDGSFTVFEGNVSTRPYFQSIMSGGPSQVTPPLASKTTGKMTVYMVAPIKDDAGKPQGFVGAGIQLDFLFEAVKELSFSRSSYGLLIAQDGMIMAYPDESVILKNKLNEIDNGSLADLYDYMKKNSSGIYNYRLKGVKKTAFFSQVQTTGWIVAVTVEERDLYSKISTLKKIFLGGSIITILLIIAAIFLISNSIVKQIRKIVNGLKDIAEGEGDLTMRLEVTSRDEIGETAKWFNIFIEKLQFIIKDIAENSRRVDDSSIRLNKIAGNLTTGASNTAERASTLSVSAEKMTGNLNSIVTAIDDSTTNTTMVATAAEEMSVTINEIVRNTTEARSISEDAVSQSRSTSERMVELKNVAQEIGKVTETIAEISEQTNLLALNATIEAARAGEAGKGFAVVANEIKELARQTAEATLSIKEQIEEVQGTTSVTAGEIGGIVDIIMNINSIVNTIATSVDEQSMATKEIANNISQASRGMTDVNSSVTHTSSVAQEITEDIFQINREAGEIADSSSQVKNSASELQEMSVQLNTIIGRFKV